MVSTLKAYVNRMTGQRFDPSLPKNPSKPPSRLVVLVSSFVASFIGISIVASLNYNAQWFIERNTPVIAGSFGASAVLIYGAIEAPLSQPRNAIGGHIMAAVIGVSLYKLFNLLSTEMFDKLHWLLCALAVSCSLTIMQLTHTVHPPASATALIAVTGGPGIYDLGYWYVLCPIALGIMLMMVVAMLVNNVARRYPTHWWNPKTKKIAVVDQDMSTTIADFVPPSDERAENLTKRVDTNATRVVNESSRSSVTASPSSNDLSSQTRSHHSHPHHHHHQPQFAIYYGGEHHEDLRDHEKMREEHDQADLEHGHAHGSPIIIEKRGSHSSTPAGSSDEEYRATIAQLQRRIHELEEQLASVPK
ncbi:HPP family-domain-containing protein [Mortierella sp. GBAus27b]|nr:hypothetical protein BGX31_002940 [Mortierella sp. GBA43]KAI8351093.1 HPP family-domain-containing protein [Mortierella sp. GBAus27b]